jgi:hypothetical protein
MAYKILNQNRVPNAPYYTTLPPVLSCPQFRWHITNLKNPYSEKKKKPKHTHKTINKHKTSN